MFVNTRLLSPVRFDGIPKFDDEEDEYEKHDYWEIQRDRCLNGYEAGGTKITGLHYWYLNFWLIRAEQRDKDGNTLPGGKRLQHPDFLDMDHEFFWEFQKARQAGEDMLCLKRRQAGFSYKASAIAGHEYTFFPNSHSIITSGQEEFSKNTTRMVLIGLNDLAETEFYKSRLINSAAYIQSGYKLKLPDGQEQKKGYLSIVQQITAATPQALIGKSASLVIYEEIGKFPGLIATKAYTDPAMEVGGRKTGIQLLIGTGGEENESIDEVEKMVMDPKTYGIRSYENIWEDKEADFVGSDVKKSSVRVSFFIPAWKFHIVDKDGNSLKEESLKSIQARRDALKHDKDRYLKELTQFPLTIEEALMVPDGNVFDVVKLREIMMAIRKYPEENFKERRGEIKYVIGPSGLREGVEWEDKVDGRYLMTEPPEKYGMNPDGSGGKVKQDLYLAGTDSYDRDQTASSHGSFGSCIIYKLIKDSLKGDYPVCRLTERPATSEEFYEDTVKMCLLYGGNPGMNLIEYSNLGIFNWYLGNGYEYLLKERPEVAYANVANPQVQNRYGIDPAVKAVLIQGGIDWVAKYAHQLRDTHLISRLIKYKRDPKYNCDDTIAFCLAIMNRNDYMSKLVLGQEVVEATDEFRMLSNRYSMQGGRMVRL